MNYEYTTTYLSEENMNTELSTEEYEHICDTIIEPTLDKLRKGGQKEYAQDVKNVFANFQRVADDIDVTIDKAIWVYMRKHIDGIKSHIKGHRSQREPIGGRIGDLIIYLKLLWAYEIKNEKVE